MLEDIKTLSESITDDQRSELGEILSSEAYDCFKRALLAQTEQEASDAIDSFVLHLKKNVFLAMKLMNVLSPEQRDIIQKLRD